MESQIEKESNTEVSHMVMVSSAMAGIQDTTWSKIAGWVSSMPVHSALLHGV